MTDTTEYAPPLDTYAGVRPERTIYLFSDHTITLPRGHVVLLCGMGGVGKGMVAVDFAARVSRGETASGEPGTTIMVTPEDDAQETVAWRLRAARADTRRVVDLTTLDGGAPFRLDATRAGTGSVGQLRATIDRLAEFDDRQRLSGITDPARLANPVLVVIEPLLACVTAGSIHTDTGARHVLAPLQQLARETGVTVLITHHMTKGGGDVAGSRAIVNAPRLVYEIVRDPDHDQVALITLRKTNIMGTKGGSRYMIAGDGTDARVVWARPQAELEDDPEQDRPGLLPWRARALKGPLAAIDGAQLEPVRPFDRMRQGDMVAHMRAMHNGTTPDFLERSTLIALHNVRHDADALVPHRHGKIRAMLAITAGGETDDTGTGTDEEAAQAGSGTPGAGDGGGQPADETAEPGGEVGTGGGDPDAVPPGAAAVVCETPAGGAGARTAGTATHQRRLSRRAQRRHARAKARAEAGREAGRKA